MSRNVIELALTRYYRQDTNPNASALRTLAKYDADRRAEALAEGADAINALPQDWECDPGRGDAAKLLRRMAGEKSSRKADATPTDFFQPGRTYRHSAWSFRCAAVTLHPATGELTAIGWLCFRDNEWTSYSYSAAEWGDDWTDVTDGGDD